MGRWSRYRDALASQPPVSQPWAVAPPSNGFLIELLLAISLISIGGTVAFKRLKRPHAFVKACGVRARKVQRTMQEVERKTFHLATLLVPIIHQILLSVGWSNAECVKLCWVITAVGWTADLARVHGPEWAKRLFPLKRLLRESEKNRITGGCYLSLGCTLTMAISPPSITMASILFLVLGDLSAAIIGVSFGKETVSLKLGRQGKKSAEGSAAMLVICFVVGCTAFCGVELREYPVAIGALAIHIHMSQVARRHRRGSWLDEILRPLPPALTATAPHRTHAHAYMAHTGSDSRCAARPRAPERSLSDTHALGGTSRLPTSPLTASRRLPPPPAASRCPPPLAATQAPPQPRPRAARRQVRSSRR